MKCLKKYSWVKVPRGEIPFHGKGILIYYMRLASRAAFRKGTARYCGYTNAVEVGSWVGGMVGLKSILEVKKRRDALEIMDELQMLGYLIRLNILSYEDCLKFLDTENTGDMIAMSYVFRPLTKNGYVVKSKDGVVAVLQKGRDLFPEEGPLISVASRGKSRLRVLHVSRVCMWMEKNGVPISGELLDTEEPYFIPSARWRDIAKGILSTTRFAGVLLAYEKRYAVYDIGDGTMDWQLRAESSLFYYKYGSFKTKADGMILICEDGKKHEIARQIIRQTMWARKMLLKDKYAETDKPVKYSRSPIKLRTQYERVYLTTPALLSISLERIYDEEYYIANGVRGAHRLDERKLGDVEVYPMQAA